ncbi:MAG: nucleotidyl transferase AbiEii/AbiGii toxin family protein [Deltaproteobacteria bacterium]|nr:nucleotidyl transferase AbiEii/AbiGii toxin family protein [Deltaproteobacteria bacterium]
MSGLELTIQFFEGLVTRERPGGYWSTFEEVVRLLGRKRRTAFAGALALSAHGMVRATEDIDVLVHPEEKDRLVREMGARFVLREDLDTLLVYADRETGTEVDLLVAFDPISLEACSSPARARVRGKQVRVVSPENLTAMKVVAAVDSPGIEAKQRADVEQLVRSGLIDVNRVSRLLQDEAGREYAKYFITVVRHVRAHPARTAPKRKL